MSAITTSPINHGPRGTSPAGSDTLSTDTVKHAPVMTLAEVPIEPTNVTEGDIHTEGAMGVKDHLPILWYFSPPGSQAVNTVATEDYLYVGHRGRVYRLSRQTGVVQAEQELKNYGFEEVSVAISEDRSLLFIATNGKLVSLDPMSLKPGWSKEVPDSNGRIRILLTNDRIYTGSGGTVHVWSLNGAHINRRSIDQNGFDIRFDISSDNGFLVAGTRGLIRAYKLPDLSSTHWEQDVPDQGGSEPTSVVCGSDFVYAADIGWVYQLRATDGFVLKKRDFSKSAGSYEVNLALDKTSNRLYAGCNGYGICMDATSMEVFYKTSLPGAGWNVTSVVSTGRSAVFGCKGRVFQLDTSGKVVAQNDLDGYGNGNTSLTFCGPDRLWACPDGYVVAMLMLVVP
ncbi:quino alcohol dehydrogenase [Fusarium globosum]|uniref:Quino alcohol dehydrogenase n=1 Tax=Fusarium globosum TaxID=78864 RepID=A0A8H6DG32_9HYPO|nr:quino alcohol dehydrogenase [Fusarium globosum]